MVKKVIFKFLILFLIIDTLFSCDTLSGHRGLSENILESKERKVFFAKYIPISNPVIINDTIKITIKEAWLEKQWAYSDKRENTIIFNGELYQLCINTNESDIQNIGQTWLIGIDFNQSIRKSGESSLIGDFSKTPSDTLCYKVQKGVELSNNYKKIIIGNFVLIRDKPL